MSAECIMKCVIIQLDVAIQPACLYWLCLCKGKVVNLKKAQIIMNGVGSIENSTNVQLLVYISGSAG